MSENSAQCSKYYLLNTSENCADTKLTENSKCVKCVRAVSCKCFQHLKVSPVCGSCFGC